MKLVRADGESFEFALRSKEKELLLHVLKLYPLIPERHHRLSRSQGLPDQEENQRLLDEALQSQRVANKKLVLAMVNEPGRFAPAKSGLSVTFSRVDIEWLLQVLNDIRVGSWLAMGSPGYEEAAAARQNKEFAQQRMMMDLAAAFELLFLEAVSGGAGTEHE